MQRKSTEAKPGDLSSHDLALPNILYPDITWFQSKTIVSLVTIASTHRSSLGPTADAGFTLSGVPLAGVDKALMPCLHYCIVVQLSFMS